MVFPSYSPFSSLTLFLYLWALSFKINFFPFFFFPWIYLDVLSNVNQFNLSNFLSGLGTRHHKDYY